ncbi:hypothetical protein BLOT_012952 [Blomia tropicalis]|nr:hypothetical protein BLOT_012952 [Blomia tropicalis]
MNYKLISFFVPLLLIFNVSIVPLMVNGASSNIKAAPYYMPLDNDPQNIDDIVANSGIRHFIFAFVLATTDGQCIPTWDGLKSQRVEDDRKVLEMIGKVRSHGGDVSISFGGYNGVELGHVCRSPEQLASAYQLVIDKYGLTHVDFDIEGDDLGAVDEELKRFHAIKILKHNAQTKGRQLHVTLTMPCTTVGLSELGKAEIKRAISVQQDLIDLYKIMAFDYGGPGGSMSDSVIQIMEMIHQQIGSLRTDLNVEQIYEHMGIILMNGHTDQPSEMFTLDTFEHVMNYARTKHYGRLSYWSLNRDRPCPSGKNFGWAAGTCSSIVQTPWQFTKIIAKFVSNDDVRTERPETSTITRSPTTTTTTSANPTTNRIPQTVDCTNTHGEQYFPYNGDCHKYIRCYEGVAHIEQCPPGLLYDLQLHVCNWEHDVNRPECFQH